MKEVFEKIIDLLQKEYYLDKTELRKVSFNNGISEAIKIVKQTYAEYSNGHFGCNTNGEHERCDGCGLTDCKSRNKIWFGAVDDNNGWIPCSKRLPEEGRGVILYVENKAHKGSHVVFMANIHNGEWQMWETSRQTEINYTPVAWHPLPDPYNPNTCQDTNCPYNDGNDCPAADGCAGYERKITNFDRGCESMEAMAQIIDIVKIGWTKDQIMEWLQKEVEE